jgi:hypothetical protein
MSVFDDIARGYLEMCMTVLSLGSSFIYDWTNRTINMKPDRILMHVQSDRDS